MRILLIDNYDSFTYNLVQRIGELDASLDVRVVRNDKIDADDANALQPSHLIIVAGRPSMGKTSFALSVVSNIALR